MRAVLVTVATLALAGCAIGVVSGSSLHSLGHSITPGLTLRCAGHCVIYPANVDNAPAPGERAVPDHP